jgi:ABC-type sulfate transport system substrate-binding protein
MESPRWPFMTTFTYVTTHMKSDVAAGYLTFLVSNDGQKIVMNQGYRPASVPVRIIQMKPEDSTEVDSTKVETAKPDTQN